MQFNEFPEITTLNDEDLLLVQEATTLALRSMKLSTLKQYIGVSSTTPSLASPPTGFVKWYRADEVSLSGNSIVAVIDKSPSKNNLIPLFGNPTLTANAINDKAAINFNNAALKHNAENYAAKTIFLVFRKNTTNNFTDYDGYLAYRTTNFNKGLASNEDIIFTGVPQKNNLYLGFADTVYLDNVSQNTNNSNDYMIGIPFSVNSFHILEAMYTNSVVGNKNIIVGADSNSTGRYLQNQDIAEIIIYPNLLSSQERTNIYSYFKSYYAFSFL